MTVARNLIAGVANSIWSALLGLAVVPFYLKYLGIEAYGLIGFFVTAQVLLQLLDMGMASTINREVARCAAAGDIGEAAKLLHTLAIIYWVMAAAIALLIVLLAPLISTYWLKSEQLSPHAVTNAIMLMGVVLASRWPIGLYQGALIGAQRLTVSSAINMMMVSIGSFGAIVVLAYVSPTIEAFFFWQACVGFVYAVGIRSAAWRCIGRPRAGRFDVDQIRRVLRFSVGVGAISIAGLVLTQLDKVILSKTVGLESFGKYMLATMVANSLYLLIVPIFNASYPRFTSLVAQRSMSELLVQYGTTSQLLASLLFPSAMVMVLLAQPLIVLWTGNVELAIGITPLVALLLIAYSLHGVMYMPYALMLAHGETKPMFAIYIILIVIVVPMTLMLAISYGALGGAFAQFLHFAIYLVVGAWVTHRQHFKGYARIWLARDIGIPLGISFIVWMPAQFIMQITDTVYLQLMVGVALWLLTISLSIYSMQLSRSVVIGFWKKIPR